MTYEFEVAPPAAANLRFRCLGSSDLQSWAPLAAVPEIIVEAKGLRPTAPWTTSRRERAADGR